MVPNTYTEAADDECIGQQHRWSIRPLYIFIPRISDKLTNDSCGYARLYLSEMEPGHVDDSYSTCLAVFNLDTEKNPAKRSGEYTMHEFKNSTFHETTDVPLQRLHFWLTDSSGESENELLL